MNQKLRKTLRVVVRVLVVALIVALAAGIVLWWTLRASLPQLDGSLRLAGLSHEVRVERDGLGVPTVRALDRMDAVRATGFLHAQERFFQMDLLRRTASGELSELLGPAVVETDRYLRFHRFRAVARETVRRLPPDSRKILEVYAEGVNQGLAALGARPPEYLALRSRPASWVPEDTVLCVLTLFFDLQDDRAGQDRALALMARVLPPPAFDFFVPLGGEWDAAIDGSVLPAVSSPKPEEFSFGRSPRAHSSRRLPPGFLPSIPDLPPVGSNSWALDGGHSAGGSALVANDMHLGLTLPNTWYRLRIVCQASGESSLSLDITGVSLPGAPAIVVGSNTYIAWAFTNAMLDTTDFITLETSGDRPGQYRTPDGWRQFEEHREILHVRGAADERLTVRSTIWGPVLPGRDGKPEGVVRWVAQLAGSADLSLMSLEFVHDTETALALAPTVGVPVQNFVVGDRQGRIGWTLLGRLPRRIGYSGRIPVSWADGSMRWDGWLPATDYPRIFAPEGGRLWTANNRIAGNDSYMAMGPWQVDLGARARQIRDDLARLETASPRDMLAIQLDDRALFLQRWRGLLLSALRLPVAARRAGSAEIRQLVENWGGRASADSAGYRLVRGFRASVMELLLEPITEQCRKIEPRFRYPTSQVEHPAWVLVTKRPLHLLNPRFQDYDQLLVAALDSILKDFEEQGLKPAEATWGLRNTVHIQHPLSQAVARLGWWLDIPAEPLPGDSHMPRVQSPGHGASERLAVAPGHEKEALFQMPGGQSGHFLSPYYRSGHEAWAHGKPAPFLPGPPRHTLRLQP